MFLIKVCGIITGISKNGHKVSKSLIKKYQIQKSRGHEGFGYCALNNGVVSHKRAESEADITRELKRESSQFIMFHHRFPTSTINVEECSHPIHVTHDELDYDYYVVHNGVIRNCDELKAKHETDYKYVYNTVLHYSQKSSYKSLHTGNSYKTVSKDDIEYNDTESFAIELARYLDGMSGKIDCVGSIAFVCMQTTKDGKFVKLHYGHNSGSPLMTEEDAHNVWIKSVGGRSLEEDIIYTSHYKEDGSVEESQKNIRVGFSSDYGRSHPDYTPAKNINTTTDWNEKDYEREIANYDSTRTMGFKLPKTCNLSDLSDDEGRSDFDEMMANEDKLVRKMIGEYCELQFEVGMLEDDLAVAEDMLIQPENSRNAFLIETEVIEIKKEIAIRIAKMEKLEEDYCYKIKGQEDFLDLVERYQEEEEYYTSDEYQKDKKYF